MAQALLDRDGIPSLFGDEWKDLITVPLMKCSAAALSGNLRTSDALGRKLEDLEKKLTYSLVTTSEVGDVIKHLRKSGRPCH